MRVQQSGKPLHKLLQVFEYSSCIPNQLRASDSIVYIGEYLFRHSNDSLHMHLISVNSFVFLEKASILSGNQNNKIILTMTLNMNWAYYHWKCKYGTFFEAIIVSCSFDHKFRDFPVYNELLIGLVDWTSHSNAFQNNCIE